MNSIQILIQLVEYILYIYFGFAAIYVFIFALASQFPYKPKRDFNCMKRKIAVLIPGYKEDAVIIDVANDALKQNYPQEMFDVVIIADSFQSKTIESLKKLPIKLVEVSFDVSTKSKALNKAMATIGDDYDIALILDADNTMAPDVLERINESFENRFKVVQGHRAAKNLNTSFAILDAISEELNNSVFRHGHRVLGFSSALIGSGMAFDYSFFKQVMSEVKAIGGFDKELELMLLKNKEKIEYLPDAIVYDEKIQKSDAFANQRKRWLSAQFIYFRRYFFSGLKELFLRGNIDFFDKVYQMVSPPRVLLLGVVTMLTIVYGLVTFIPFIADFLTIEFSQWIAMALLVYVAFVLAIPRSFYNVKTIKAIVMLPKAFAVMFISLFKLKGANKKFIHTSHGVEDNKEQ